MYCSNLKTKQTNRTVILAFKVGSLWGKFKSARCRSFARRRQALNNLWEVLCENLHKLEDSQRWEKKKLNKNQITKKKTNNFFDKNKTKNKEFVSLLI